MSVLTGNILTRNTTDLMGFGVVLNPDGSVASISGATMEYTTVAPTAVRNGGSLALRSNGSLYATAGAGVWVLIGGASSGWVLPNDVPGVWGTTAPLQVTSVYVSAANRWDLSSGNVSQAGAGGASAALAFATGTSTITGAANGGPSGSITWATGGTDSTNIGGTGGSTGDFIWSTGTAAATAGTSGNSGGFQWTTGASVSGNSGSMVWTIGAAGGTQGTLQMVGRLTTTDGVTAGTARVVGGRAFSTTADSGVITGNGAAQAFNQTYSIPANTLKAGSTVRVWGCVRRVAINAADTAQIFVRLGGTSYVSSTAVAAAAGDRAFFEMYLTARAAPGAAVTVVGIGRASWSTAAAPQNPSGATANLATNGALVADVQINMPNNVGNTAVLEQFFIDVC